MNWDNGFTREAEGRGMVGSHSFVVRRSFFPSPTPRILKALIVAVTWRAA